MLLFTVCKVVVSGVVSLFVCIVKYGLFHVSWLIGCNVSWCSVCSGCCAFCLSCDACITRCCSICSILVSSCRCCVLVSRVHPVVIRSAVFSTVCSLFVFVSDIIGDQVVFPYSSVVLVMAVYVLKYIQFTLVYRIERILSFAAITPGKKYSNQGGGFASGTPSILH